MTGENFGSVVFLKINCGGVVHLFGERVEFERTIVKNFQ
jgi:hypothetical protein